MNDITSQLNLDPHIKKVRFEQFQTPIFFGNKIATVIGIWDTDPLDGGSDILTWKKVVFSVFKPDNSDVYIFISNTDTPTESYTWTGPFRNSETSLLSFSKRYFRIRAVLIQRGELKYQYNYQEMPVGPYIDSLSLSCVTSGSAAKFFTKTMELGFNAKYILLTSETTIPEGSIIRYGVTNLDSVNLDYYQFFDVNKITKLNKLPVTGEKLKVYIEMSGNSGDPIIVHEFAIMFSGDEQIPTNQL